MTAPTTARPTRTRRQAEIAEALGHVPDGAVVGIGGTLTAGRPMALLRELLRRRPQDLTLVSPVASLDFDLAVASGCVRRVVTSYVGAEGGAGVGPVLRAAAERGQVEIVDRDEAQCILGLRAAGQGLPFLPWLGGVGTDIAALASGLVEFDDPIAGRPLLAVPAIELDIALIHAECADAYGNVQFAGTGHADPVLAAAAERVVVQCDRIVSNTQIRRHPGATHFWRRSTTTRTPWGTHPYASALIEADAEHLNTYVDAARAAVRGEPDPLANYLERYVYVPAAHEDYLETIGVRRIAELLT